MFISPVTLIKNNSFNANVQKQETPKQGRLEQCAHMPSFLGQQKVYSDKVSDLKLEMRSYPQDVKYRKKLLENMGLNPVLYYRLRSIIGSGEIKDIMADYQKMPEVYSTGENDSHIKNKMIWANLHMHTDASDGFLTTEELLEKARIYADEVAAMHKNKAPFTIAITDHDTVDAAKEAIKIIFKNPDKYKNLRVILGTEITSYNNIATNIKPKPTCTHILLYGIDPNEKDFNNFIEEYKHLKGNLSTVMVDEANSIYKSFFGGENNFYNIEQLKKQFNPVKRNLVGIYNYVNQYVMTKILVKESVLKNPELSRKLQMCGVDMTVNGVMKEIQQYFYAVDRNNKPRNTIDALSEALSAITLTNQDTVKNMIKTTPVSQQAQDCISQLAKNLEKYKITLEPKYRYIPKINDIYASLYNQPDAMIGLAHPLDYVKELGTDGAKYEFLGKVYKYFKQEAKEKAIFAESYYQSYNPTLKNLQDQIETKIITDELSEMYRLYQTGSSDTHRENIFKRGH